jgi:hypothetical protein
MASPRRIKPKEHLVLLISEAAADRRGIGVVLPSSVTAMSDERLIIQDAGGRSRGRSRLKRDGLFEVRVVTTAIALIIVTPKILTLL